MTANNPTLAGYVIIPPISTWDEKHRDAIIPEMSYSTFGKTPTEAWVKMLRTVYSDADLSVKIQRAFDKGYRLKKAKMIVLENEGE